MFTVVELKKQVPPPILPKITRLVWTWGNAVRLPQDIADLATEDSEEFEGKLIMMGAQVHCLSHSILHFLFSFNI